MSDPKLVLASSSTSRQQLLNQLKIKYSVANPDINELVQLGEQPADQAVRLAIEKGKAVINAFPEHLIISSDQVAICQGKQLKKPGNRENNIAQLKQASGHCVEFYTSICVTASQNQTYMTDLDICRVYFKTLTDQQISNYVDIDQAYHCAGGFKAESLGVALFERIEVQDPSALIGLPLIKLCAILDQFGVKLL